MDIPGVNDDWDHQMTPLLQDMSNCGGPTTGTTDDDYHFNPELLASGGQTTTASAQSPISATNAPSLSPSGASGTGAPSGALSPGAMSQTSTTNAPAATSCCENGRPMITDPVSGQTVCSCQYDSARIALSGYSRIPTASVYGTPYPSTDQNPYPSIGVDSSAFYSPLSNPYALKESGPTGDMSAWTSAGLPPTTGYYTYDPTLTAYGYGAGYDLAARRKNATRESTATLKAWLNEHKKNPYPTKGEKIMLAIITKMTLTQVSTWFANARRRLKKENKMTWEPKNKTDDDDDAIVSDDEKDKDDDKDRDHKDSLHRVKSEHEKDDDEDDLTDDERKAGHHHEMLGHNQSGGHHYHPYYHPSMFNQHHHLKSDIDPKNQTGSDCGVPIPASKPKIWSLADTAACKTPPPHHHLHQAAAAASAYNPNHQWMSGGANYEQQGPMSQQQHLLQQQQQQQQQHLLQQQQQQQQQQHPQQIQHQGHPPAHHHHQQQQPQQNGNPMQMMSQLASGIAMGTAGGMGPGGHNSNMGVPPNMGGMGMNYDNYTRYGTASGFLGQASQQGYNNNNNTETNTPPVSQQMPQNMVNQRSPHHGAATMGFPEVQTDTPPQTPPNMKLPNVVGNLITNNNNSTNHPSTPTTGTCFSNSSSGYGSSPEAYMGTFRMSATPTNDSSPQKRQTEFNNNTMVNNNNNNANTTNNNSNSSSDYKPFFKNSPQMNANGFVPPV